MQNTPNPTKSYDPKSTPVDTTGKPASVPGPGDPNPSARNESATAKDPKGVGVAQERSVDRVADRAAHKAAREEQEYDKANDIFTH